MYPNTQSTAAEQTTLGGVRTQLVEANKSAAEGSNEVEKLRRKLNQQNSDLKDLNKELDILDSMKLMNQNTAALAAEVQKTRQQIANLRNK